MRCASCNRPKAKHKWDVAVCAMRGKRMTRRLCDPCDVSWNGLALAFFNHPKREKLMASYRAQQTGEA